jgi:hypothetical protein
MSYPLNDGGNFETIVGLEPTLFHIGSVVPYLLGDTVIVYGASRRD